MGMRNDLEKMLAAGRDSPLLRFSLGEVLLKEDRPADAVEHLRSAVEQDPGYSAAWKLYGKALADSGEREAAARAFDTGIATAEERGDKQAAKEMRVFLKRLKR
jgi:predicted Zn-dependent protease